MMSTLATVHEASCASMKAVNITLQHTPEIQNARPHWRMDANPQCPCKVVRIAQQRQPRAAG